MKVTAVLSAALVLFSLPARPGPAPGMPTFQQRVEAQRAIDRLQYEHQLGAHEPFDKAVPRQVTEKRVRAYLAQSAALEQIWRAPITQEALQDELERMALNTRLPDRLHEIYAALGNDPLLARECLARPILAERLISARSKATFEAWTARRHSVPTPRLPSKMSDRLASLPVPDLSSALGRGSSLTGSDSWVNGILDDMPLAPA